MATLSNDDISIKIKTSSDNAGTTQTDESLKRLNSTGKEVQGQLDKNTNASAGMTGAFIKAQLATQVITAAYQKFSGAASDSINDTMNLGREVMKMQRELGISAESASGLAAVFSRFGIDSAGASKSLGVLSKNIFNLSEPSKYAGSVFDDLGIKLQDTKGNLKGADQVFLDVADRFKSMPNGVQKTAEAMQLFGKSGKDLLPILNQGRDGIAELEQHAASMGLVLTQGNVDAIRKNIAAQKDYKEAMEGLHVQIGNALMPAMTQFSEKLAGIVSSDTFHKYTRELIDVLKELWAGIQKFIASQEFHQWMRIAGNVIKDVINVVKEVIKIWEAHKGAMRLVVQAVVSVVAAFELMKGIIAVINLIKGAWIAFTVIMEMNPIILIITAIIAIVLLLAMHWKRVCEDLKIAFHAVADFFKQHMDIILGILLGPIGLIIANWHRIFDFFEAIWGGIKHGFDVAYNGMTGWAKGVVNDIIGFFTGLPGRIGDIVGGVTKRVANDIKGVFHGLHIPGFASGVKNFGGGWAVVGENGPELLNLPQGSSVYSNADSQQMASQASAGSNSSSSVRQTVTIGTIVLQSQSAVQEFFGQLNQDTINVGRGLTPNQGATM